MKPDFLTCALLFLIPCSSGAADFIYFSWLQTSSNQYSSSLMGINATMDYSTSAGDAGVAQSYSPTDSLFVSEYGDFMSTFLMSNGVAGSSANSLSSIIFDTALPLNSILIAYDVDTIRDDEFRFSNTDFAALTLIEQLESVSNASSSFPIWNQPSQSLRSAGAGGNQSEASIFNIGGNQTLDVSYFRNAGGNSIGGSVFAIGIAVPEPSSVMLLFIGASLLCSCRTRKYAE